jgi:hypothetical protein
LSLPTTLDFTTSKEAVEHKFGKSPLVTNGTHLRRWGLALRRWQISLTRPFLSGDIRESLQNSIYGFRQQDQMLIGVLPFFSTSAGEKDKPCAV